MQPDRKALPSFRGAKSERHDRLTGLRMTHQNLLDGTPEGVESVKDKLFSVQYHPESAPGPQDSAYLFTRFINMMEEKA